MITGEGYIRFTPDFYQSQEVAFLIPQQEKELGLGLRVQNRVYSLPLTASPAAWPPVKPVVTHRDGQTMEMAQEIILGESLEAGVQRDYDWDWFKLINDEPGKSLIQIDLSALPGVDSEIKIYNEKGNRIWSEDETDKDGPESIFNLALDEGVYYVGVFPREVNVKDSYPLSTRILEPWPEGMEAEPNDDMIRANEIKLNSPFCGRVNSGRDKDYYVFNVSSPGVDMLITTLSGVPGVRFNFELLDPKEKRLDYSWFGRDGQGEEMVKMKSMPGTYYLKVEVRGGKISALNTPFM